jgi:hypothetical protein
MSGNFAGRAAKEMKEEAGIEITRDALIDMTELACEGAYPGMYSSCGGSDEFSRIFLFQKAVTDEELDSLKGKLTGVAEEGEMCKLQLLPLETLWRRSPDAKALAALTLYNRLHAAGSIPELLDDSKQPRSVEAPSEIQAEAAMELMDYLPALTVDTQADSAESDSEEENSPVIRKPVLGSGPPSSPLPPSVVPEAPPVPSGSPPELPFEKEASAEGGDSPITKPVEDTALETCIDVDLDKSSATEESESRVKETPVATSKEDNEQSGASNHNTAATSPSPAPRTSLGSVSPTSGGLISAYEERVGLPRQPPPSPATPSPALRIALQTAGVTSATGEREKAAEFARAAGAALVRITGEESQVGRIDECKASLGTCDAEKLTETPRRAAAESPVPLSPLSLGSGSEDQES